MRGKLSLRHRWRAAKNSSYATEREERKGSCFKDTRERENARSRAADISCGMNREPRKITSHAERNRFALLCASDMQDCVYNASIIGPTKEVGKSKARDANGRIIEAEEFPLIRARYYTVTRERDSASAEMAPISARRSVFNSSRISVALTPGTYNRGHKSPGQ